MLLWLCWCSFNCVVFLMLLCFYDFMSFVVFLLWLLSLRCCYFCCPIVVLTSMLLLLSCFCYWVVVVVSQVLCFSDVFFMMLLMLCCSLLLLLLWFCIIFICLLSFFLWLLSLILFLHDIWNCQTHSGVARIFRLGQRCRGSGNHCRLPKGSSDKAPSRGSGGQSPPEAEDVSVMRTVIFSYFIHLYKKKW